MSFRITDPFWSELQRRMAMESLPHQWRMCEETPRFENFRRVAAGKSDGHQGQVYDDSDVYKILEACAYAEARFDDFPLKGEVAEMAETIARAQAPDGYIHTLHQLGRMDERYLATIYRHELYCLGHLIEAGCAFAEEGLESPLIDVTARAVAHVLETFGPGRMDRLPGHQEIELTLCRWADLTGDEEPRQLAWWMLDRRGRPPHVFEVELDSPLFPSPKEGLRRFHFDSEGRYDGRYHQDAVPLVELDEPHGHAVRLMYQLIGAVQTGRPEGRAAAERVLDRIEEGFLYVTGGIGSSGSNEGFTTAFDLPNENAYAETCAAIGLVMLADLVGRHDLAETALFNAALSGVGADGRSFFYDNPLAAGAEKRRQPWFTCACCPPNLARLILSLDRRCAVWRNGRLEVRHWISGVWSGVEGRVEISAATGPDASLRLASDQPIPIQVRVPAWLTSAEWSCGAAPEVLNGEVWLRGRADPERIPADPRVEAQAGRFAVRQGPWIMAMEEADLGAPVESVRFREPSWDEAAGRVRIETDLGPRPMIRYADWANREPGSMAVWLRV
ncbi:MAG: glycoside hydrolase family 127 protein [Fimbriimonadaceae bacterium]|nr:glycoside hydrolase family 127 protein [Fimbriimonadaceae bacterium]